MYFLFSCNLWACSFCRFVVCFVVRTTRTLQGRVTSVDPLALTWESLNGPWSFPACVAWLSMTISDGHILNQYCIVCFETCSHSRNLQRGVYCFTLCGPIWKCTEFYCSWEWTINNWRKPVKGAMAREKNNRSDIADLHIHHATEHDEREGWVSVFSWNFCVEK